jgi:hypothetical protein
LLNWEIERDRREGEGEDIETKERSLVPGADEENS